MPAALGNLAEAIEEELARVRRFPGPPAQRLTNLASSCDDWWPLACRPELQARVRALFHDARLPVPTAVQALWIPRRESPPGRALFPLALRGARGEAAAGSLRDLRVGLVSPDGQQHRPTDRGFLRAIDNARSLACTLAGRADRASAEPDWWLCPNVESNTDLDGGSVALAAFVAFSSWALRVPVPRSHVFTGVLGADAFSAPSGLTLDQKLEAADRSGMAETLFCPGLTDAQWQRLAQG